jgi:hypothetical protein
MESYTLLDKEKSRTARARYDGALSANTALQNLLKREAGKKDAIELMGSSNFLTCTTGRRDFTRQDGEWVYLNGQGENFSLRDVSLSEDIFAREEVSVEETFKVAGIPLRPFFSHGEVLRPTKVKVGLYQINQSMEEWSERLYARLLLERDRKGRPLDAQEVLPICVEDPEWVNDDTGLIGKCLSLVSGDKSRYKVCLVSGDRRLANKMAETCNVTVIRIDPKSFVSICHRLGREITATVDAEFLSEYNVAADYYLVDSGSVAAASVQLVDEGGKLYRRTVHTTGWDEGTRFSKITLTKLDKPRLRVEHHKPVLRPKIWRSGSRSYESAYSSHSSWRESRRRSSTDSSWWRRSEPTAPILRAPGGYSESVFSS